ncbi:hypothetical protein BHE74_00037597 [Ensete ventricosum]|uniref:Uncharacterized protein n=1 Tax=Ensete ventricosum TaxID=4639 RepID=A0A426Z3M0_ENSVE|nr:hypothetical protein B296_00022274 [Ensete ventricosum]RWW55755.1 hypothetical protein BHE74_00037597 [Ensete ventricosum]
MFILGSHEQESINLIEAIGGEVELRPPTVDVDAEKGTSRYGSPVKPAAGAADAIVDRNGGTGADDYMSKLISISYMQSPDVKPSLPLVEKPGP